jgi:hypothetical protein
VPQPAHGLRAAWAVVILSQTTPAKETTVSRVRFRPRVESLDDRCLPSFSPVTSFPVGTTPDVVATADFNNDGRLDLATSNDDGSVSVLLGDGRGGFGAANQLAALSIGRALAVGDFNNDGNSDLATVGFGPGSYNSTELSVLLGTGDGTFRPPVITGLPDGSPLSVAVGDFDADGNTDLVCTYFSVRNPSDPDDYYSAVQVLLGNGGGGFGGPEYRLPGTYPKGLAVADLNADGNLDVVTADNYTNTVSVLTGYGDGTLGYFQGSDFATGPSPLSVAVGDFTGDGIPDLVTAGQTVDLLPGLGAGAFAPPTHLSTINNGTVAAADFNGDGKLDVVTAAGTVSVLLGNGDGGFSPPFDNAAGSLPGRVAVGDFNGDGRPDVAASNAGSGTVSVLLNDGDWSPNTPRLQIGDVTVNEGNTGTTNAVFTVTLSRASDQAVTVAYATGGGGATAGSDYRAASGTVTFAPGETSKTITVLVIGDRLPEPTETFAVNLSNPTNATITDGQGVGTILDDEPRISIGDVSKLEGKNGKTSFVFTVTLSAAYDQAVTMSYQTVNGTATTSDGDYVAKTGTLTFAPGETTKTITIVVNGDSKREADEYFYLDLFGNSGNSLFAKNRGTGTILNDD